MSRTRHHRCQKNYHNGHDLWSKRGGLAGYSYGVFNKWLTRRKERHCKNKEIQRSIKEGE